MAETLFGLARLGHTDGSGMPNVLRLALIAREFRDVVVFRSPPPAVQNALFGALAPLAPIRLPRDLSAAFADRARAAPADARGGELTAASIAAKCGAPPGLQVDRRIRRIQD